MKPVIAHRRNVLFDGEFYDTLTNLFSFIPARQFGYAHSELVFSDGVAFSSLFTISKGQCVLPEFSRPRGGLAMFRRKDGYEDRLWRFTVLPITRKEELELRAACEALVRECIAENEEYDRKGVLRFVWPWAKEDANGYFCSEATYKMVHEKLHLLRDAPAFKVSPNLLFRLSLLDIGWPVLPSKVL